MGKREITLRQLSYRMILAVFVPVLVVLLFCGTVFVTSLSRNRRATLSSAVSEYSSGTLSRMDIGRRSVQTLYFINNAGRILELSRDKWQIFSYSDMLIERCEQSIELQDNILCYFLTYGEDGGFRYTYRAGAPSFLQEDLKPKLLAIPEGETAVQEWNIVESLGVRYLTYTYGRYGVFLTVVMDMPSEYENSAVKLAFEYDGEAYGQSAELVTDRVRGSGGDAIESIVLPFAKERIPGLDLTVYAFLDGYNIGAGFTVYLLVALMALAAVVGGVVSLRLIRKNLIDKLSAMQETIATVTDGDIDARMDTGARIVELASLEKTFNTMLSQIKSLKIESYEKTMDQQKTMLQYLRMQLKPHFVLNCMTSLYALAKQKELEKLEDRILTMSDYFRYELQDDFGLRPLSEELQFIRNAVKIRGDSGNFQIEFKEKVEQRLLDIQVPALVIETFVENSIKYAVPEGKLVIQVNVALIESEDDQEPMLDIIVTDNGRGYDEAWLSLINSEDTDGEYGSHVGLVNLKKRLQIQYAGRQRMQVMSYHGAISEVLIPVTGDMGGDQYEFTDS